VVICTACGQENPDGFRFCGACAAPLASGEVGQREERKVVTIVFADLAGSTALGERLDPEALRDLQTRYFAAMRKPLERHGGTVEKYIGDAVMAVFGVPVLHEDDAVRAVRAAIEMRDAMAELNIELMRDLGVGLELRVGLDTGEVAGGDTEAGHGFVAGDAVNTAARLQSSAPPGGIVLGQATRRLVEGAVRLRPRGSVELKGKRRATRLWEVVGLAGTSGRSVGVAAVPLVGRGVELRMLRTRFERAVRRRRCVLATVSGSAGIGKSRLLREFLGGVDDQATVAVGRCLPYGDGITYWPLIEIMNDLVDPGSPAFLNVLTDDPESQAVSSRVAAVMGGTGGSATDQDVQWAVRRLLEALARRRPLVVFFDDIHWAEPAMLDLIEHLAAHAAAPILIVCATRGDLFERRLGWATAGGRGSVIRLDALSPAKSARLLRQLASRRRTPVRRDEVMAAAEGNPLFLEQLVAMRADDPTVRTPATIQALLAARIDALPLRERRVVEAASIEGRGFHRGAVRALMDNSRGLDAALSALVDRELIRPARSEFAGDAGYRFTHILVRDATYELLAKRRRADLHVAYADWLKTRDDRGSAANEIIGYHFEQAYRYRSELGRVGDARHADLAALASRHLSVAGRRALVSGDRRGAANLLERAVALHASCQLLIDLGGVYREEGRFSEAEVTLRRARAFAVEVEDAPLGARAQVEQLLSRLQVDPDAVARRVNRRGEHLEQTLAAAGDHGGLARLWQVRALLWWIRAQCGEAERAWRRAADEAALAGEGRIAADALGWEASSMGVGPTPVDAAITRCREICQALRGDPWAESLALHPLASLHAMRGEFEVAHRLLDDSATTLAGFGPTVDAAVSDHAVNVYVLSGDLERAEHHLRAGKRLLESMGERAVLASTESYLAKVMLLAGRDAAADRFARRSAAIATADDAGPQTMWRQVRARVLARRGHTQRAVDLAREAVTISSTTDHLNLQADATADLAIVLEAARDADRAAAAFASAVSLYDQKGNLVRSQETARCMEHAPRALSNIRK
jgi:class 3 adenylate cyclase/tetratricopeptide (TPR) repeat protein